MAGLIAPLLLILAALGGLLVIIGRRLPEIRGTLKATERAGDVGDQTELSLAPRTTTLEPPRGILAGSWLPILRGGTRSVARGAGHAVRVLVVGLARTARLFHRLFSRAPVAERIPQPGTRNGLALPTAPVLPPAAEPLSTNEELAAPEPATVVEETLAVTPPAAPPAFPEVPASPPVVLPPAAQVEPAVPAVAVSVPGASPADETPVTVETTREERTARRRRVVGRVRTSKSRRVPVPPAGAPEPAGIQEDERPAAWVSTSQTIPALIEEGKLDRAESLLVDILSKDPHDAESYRLLGMVYLKRQEYQQACEVFEEVLRRDPGHRGIRGLLGDAYVALGEVAKALAMYQRAHDADEGNLEYLEKLLVLFSHMDRRPMVKVTAEKILALNPDHVEAKKLLEKVGMRS